MGLYIAEHDGLITDPYRYVYKHQKINIDDDLAKKYSKWLTPAHLFVEEELPLTGASNSHETVLTLRKEPTDGMSELTDTAYAQNLNNIQQAEALKDAKEEELKSTGNKDVI